MNPNLRIEQITGKQGLLDKGVDYFWKHWGSSSNFKFYENCIKNSLAAGRLFAQILFAT